MTDQYPAKTPSPADEVTRTHRPMLALAVILTCQLMVVLDSAIVTVALPQLETALGFSPTGLSWVQNAYMLAFGGLLLLGGRAGDTFGRRRTFLAGVALFTAASLVGGLATSDTMLIVARVLQGVGAAFAAPSTLALIVSTFSDPGQRSRAIALYSTVTGAGAAIGLILGGVLTEWASWRWAFYINVPIGIIVLTLTPILIHEPPRHRTRLDIPGAILSTISAVALVYGFTRAAASGWSDPVAVGTLAVALIVGAAFLVVEAKIDQPLVPLGILAHRVRGNAYLALLLIAGSMFAMFFFVTQYFQTGLGYSPLQSGLAFLPFALFMFGAGLAVTPLIAKYGRTIVLLTGAVLLIAGLLWLSAGRTDTLYAVGILGPMIIFGIGGGLVFVPLSTAILGAVAPEDAGTASGILQASQQIGGALGTAILITVFNQSRDSNASTINENITAGSSAALVGAAILIAIAIIPALVSNRNQKHS